MSLNSSIQNIDWGVALILLIAYVFIDGLYAYYTLAVSHKRPLAAANSSAFIHILSAIGVLSYVQNFLYIVPIAIGSWAGIYIVVRMNLGAKVEKFVP